MDFIKMESVCSVNDLGNMMKRQATDLEETFASHVSNKRMASNVDKELSKFNKPKQSN